MTQPDPHSVRIIGGGRAGGSFATALAAAGWQVEVIRRGEPVVDAAQGVDLVLLCVPDGAIAGLAATLEPDDHALVAHCAGSLGLEVLAPAVRPASVHPLVALPDAERGAVALQGAWFAVAGDDEVRHVVDSLGGHAVEVDDEHRALYHAAAVIASNHLVALMGQVERLAARIGVPLEAFLGLVRGTIEHVAELGAAQALTGPVARGDWATVARHLEALAPQEREAYLALAASAAQLVGADPEVLTSLAADRPTSADADRAGPAGIVEPGAGDL